MKLGTFFIDSCDNFVNVCTVGNVFPETTPMYLSQFSRSLHCFRARVKKLLLGVGLIGIRADTWTRPITLQSDQTWCQLPVVFHFDSVEGVLHLIFGENSVGAITLYFSLALCSRLLKPHCLKKQEV